MNEEMIKQKVVMHAHSLLFATIVGSRGFGTDTTHSDMDIHGCHLLPLHSVLGFDPGQGETIERKEEATAEHPKLEIATHDIRKFCRLMLKSNGNVLEDLFSPFVLQTSWIQERLKEIAPLCISKKSANHYLGMAQNQQRGLASNEVKKVVHMYRCYLTGIHLMETGKMEIDLPTLSRWFNVHQGAVEEMLARKRAGETTLPESALRHQLSYLEDLKLELEMARDRSSLPDEPEPAAKTLLERLVIETRLSDFVQAEREKQEEMHEWEEYKRTGEVLSHSEVMLRLRRFMEGGNHAGEAHESE